MAASAQGGAPGMDRRRIPSEARETIWTAADGQAIRRIDWPGASENPIGAILFFPGRGDSYEKYLETLHCWHVAGWRVTASDWRGQAGSGRLGDDAVTGHIADFSVWVDDCAYLWAQWKTQTPGPHILVGHSMGGHLVLRSLCQQRVDPDAAVLSAPMLGFHGTVLPIALMHGASRIMAGLRGRKRPAWKWSEKPGEMPANRIDLLTHDEARYDDELFWRDHRPQLVMGPGSWGWVERAYASMRAMFAPGTLEAVDTPVLLIGARNDRLVDRRAIELAAARLPNAQMLMFGAEARHEILRETDAVRDRALHAIDEFLHRIAAPE